MSQQAESAVKRRVQLALTEIDSHIAQVKARIESRDCPAYQTEQLVRLQGQIAATLSVRLSDNLHDLYEC